MWPPNAIDAAIFLAVPIPRIRPAVDRDRPTSWPGDVGLAWRYVWSRPGLLGLLLILGSSNLVGPVVTARLAAALVLASTGNSAAYLGLVASSWDVGLGVGGAIMAAWCGPRPRRKTAREIEMLRRANEIAAFGLEAFRALYEPGRTEAEVAAQVEAAIMTRGIGHRGAAHVRAWAQLMTGPEAAHAYSLHPATSARVIARGDLGVLELGTHVDGYWSDLTRTLVAGDPPDTRQQELYAAILAGHEAVMAHARPGMTGAEVDALARQEIERRGFGEHFFHPTGHGLGFRYHEPHPLLRPGSTSLIEEGMVSSVEPGIYIEGYGGMRMEENVVFTADGVERLSVFDTSLGAS
jgi:methionine aminopeptidase